MTFSAFDLSRVQLDEIEVRVRHGGSGPPLLLLHGCPETHMMWGKIADDLARDFTVIAPDLRGYGESGRPAAAADGSTYSKRTMARDALQLMRRFGFERFGVAGHDRGARVAYRLALDHPQAVSRVSVLDIVPTGELWARADHRVALTYWHWGFLAQPAPGPEKAIAADPEHFFFRMMVRADPGIFEPAAYADYLRCVSSADGIRGVCDDYRAGAGFDRRLDREQMGRARIACPVQVLWGAKSPVGGWYDVPAVWRGWADDMRPQALDCGHFLPEEKPAETLAAFRAFFGEAN
ncbi:MAG: alpha/beta hydrolase [Phenylobacterium sp.]